MENQVSECNVYRRDYLLEHISLYRDAVKMRLRSKNSHSSNWNIAYEAGKVFEQRASDYLESLGGMAGEW